MAMQLLGQGKTLMALMLLVAFEMYLRPGEAVELCKRHVVAPVRMAGKQYSTVHVVIRDQAGLRPDKTGTFDNSLPFDKAKTEWIGDVLLRKAKDLKKKGDRIFNFSLDDFRKSFAKAGEAMGIAHLHPYQLRHGGATEDLTYAKVGRVQELLNQVNQATLQYCQWSERNLQRVFQGSVTAKKLSV